MTIRDPHGPAPEGVSASLATVVGAVSFVALAILGLGMLSFFTDTDIISVEGLSMWPGVIGMIVALIVYALSLAPMLLREPPSFSAALIASLAAAVAHVIAVWISAMAVGAGYAHALAAVSQLITQGSSIVVFVTGVIAGALAVALRRNRSGTPRWPWEGEE